MRTVTNVPARPPSGDRARPGASRRTPCSNFVHLARRMNISADDAIRQYIDLGRRGPTSTAR